MLFVFCEGYWDEVRLALNDRGKVSIPRMSPVLHTLVAVAPHCMIYSQTRMCNEHVRACTSSIIGLVDTHRTLLTRHAITIH